MNLTTKMLAATIVCTLILTAPGVSSYQAIAQTYNESVHNEPVPSNAASAVPGTRLALNTPIFQPPGVLHVDAGIPTHLGALSPNAGAVKIEGAPIRTFSRDIAASASPESPAAPSQTPETDAEPILANNSVSKKPSLVRQTVANIRETVSSTAKQLRAILSRNNGDAAVAFDFSRFFPQMPQLALAGAGGEIASTPLSVSEQITDFKQLYLHQFRATNDGSAGKPTRQTGSAAASSQGTSPSQKKPEPPAPAALRESEISLLGLYLAYYQAKLVPSKYYSLAKSPVGRLVRALFYSPNEKIKAAAENLLAALDPVKLREPLFDPTNHQAALKSGIDKSIPSNTPEITNNADQPPLSHLQRQMITNLDVLKGIFEGQYAPLKWKEKNYAWNLNQAIDQAKQKVIANKDITRKQYFQILQSVLPPDYRVVLPMDYHVHLSRVNGESATLPFSVREVEERKTVGSKVEVTRRYFIRWIDPEELSGNDFPFKIGDELTHFDGNNIDDVIQAIKVQKGKNVDATDQLLAEFYLTRRRGSSGMDIPQGAVNIAGIHEGQKIGWQLPWKYTPDPVDNPGGLLSGNIESSKKADQETPGNPHGDLIEKVRRLAFDMLSPLYSELGEPENPGKPKKLENPNAMAARKGFLPPLADKKDIAWESAEDSPFHAYIYTQPSKNNNGAPIRVGYIRIPSYDPDDEEEAILAFAEIVEKLQQTQTTKLIIDQMNNPGGSVFYMYSLLSMLTKDSPLQTPKHQMALVKKDVEAAAFLAQLCNLIKNDTIAKAILGGIFGPYWASKQFANFLLKWARFIVAEWDRGNGDEVGHVLTDPSAKDSPSLYGVDQINPSTLAQYPWDILVLINPGDFSGADFFPAILQDNKRATIGGIGASSPVRTSGAGGMVRVIEFPNELEIAELGITESIAWRPTGNPIENLGVTADPGFEYILTPADLQKNYEGAVEAIRSWIDKIQAGATGPAEPS